MIRLLKMSCDTKGIIALSVHGKRVFEIADENLRERFCGITISNHKGVYAIGGVEVLEMGS